MKEYGKDSLGPSMTGCLPQPPRQSHEDIASIAVQKAPFWIQAFGVPVGNVSTHVCEAIGKFGGELVEIDENNFKVSKPLYLLVRVLIDLNMPIKRVMRLQINGIKEFFYCYFQNY